MQNLNDTDSTREQNLILVDIDDLRTAFGGEATTKQLGELAAAPPSTVMCPQW